MKINILITILCKYKLVLYLYLLQMSSYVNILCIIHTHIHTHTHTHTCTHTTNVLFYNELFYWFSVAIPKTSVTAEPTHPKVWHHGDNVTLQCNPGDINSTYDLIFVWQIFCKSYAGQTREAKSVEHSVHNEYLVLTSVEEYANGADYTCEILIKTPVRNETTNASEKFTITIYRKWLTTISNWIDLYIIYLIFET